MLDWVHSVKLKAVANGDPDPEAPALDALLAAGLVRRREDASYEVTENGHAALNAGEPTRIGNILNWVGVIAALILVASLIERLVT